MDTLQVKLPVFEGPLELLLHLIEKNKLDIYDIPIFEITKQYLAYLQNWDNMNMEVASEFIVMAATLISIKAKRLLPAAQKQEEDEEDEEAALLRRLLVYKRYKEASRNLGQLLRSEHELVLTRKPETIQGKRPVSPPAELLKDVDLQQLHQPSNPGLALILHLDKGCRLLNGVDSLLCPGIGLLLNGPQTDPTLSALAFCIGLAVADQNGNHIIVKT